MVIFMWYFYACYNVLYTSKSKAYLIFHKWQSIIFQLLGAFAISPEFEILTLTLKHVKKLLVLLSMLGLLLPISAQELDPELFKDLRARNIGPAGMSGRVTAFDVVVSDPDIIFVGTATGGVWKSENGGISYTPIFEQEKAASIGAIAG